MLSVHPIASLDLPELAPYRTMRRQMEHREQDIFVAEGEKVVRRLIESHFTVVSVLLPQKWLDELAPQLESRPEQIRAFVAEKKLLEELTGFSMYQGVLAVGKIPAPVPLETLIQNASCPRLFVATEGLTNAENVGGLVRNCAAFGAHGLLVDATSASPYLRRAVRSSMGTLFKLPVLEGLHLAHALAELRRQRIRCVAAHAHAERLTLAQAVLREDCCIVLGSEGYGISPAVLAACDEAAAIPMKLGVDSLNVGSASAVFLYEVTRQREQR